MKKRIAIVFFAVLLVFSSIVTVNARNVSIEESYAIKLKELGLFYGVAENDFDLERAPTRVEALVMLIRVLGAEEKALKGTWKHPFTDVPSWADKYVGYAYENGLANGVSLTEFGTTNATSAQYLTFMLRALGYSDTNGNDFTWDQPYDLARHVRILPSTVDIENFWRADVAHISYVALSARLKNSNDTLSDWLIKAGVFTKEKYTEITTPQPEELPVALTPTEISEKCADAVFYMEVYSFNGALKGAGSGFFISSDGYAVTNYHVIEGARYMTITSPNGMKYDSIKVVDAYKEQDLALLKVEHIIPFEFLEIGDSTTLKQGQRVYAIGSPITLDNTMSEGIISNTRRIIDNIHYIQISVPILQGSSGGALLDEYGKVIGVTAAGYGISDLNFGIPIQYVGKLDKNANWGVVPSTDTFYPNMTQAYEFGAFTGMHLSSYEPTNYGYSALYDGKYVYEIKGIDTTIVHTVDDSLAFCLEQYGKALIQNGFIHTKKDENTNVYETDTEYVEVKLDNNKNVSVTAELKPKYYAEAKNLVDLEWYFGVIPTDKKTDGDKTVYSYKWGESWSADDINESLAYYVNKICRPYYPALHLEHDKDDNAVIYLRGNNLLITLTANTSTVSVTIEPFSTVTLGKHFDMLSAYITKNSTSAVNGKYSIVSKNDEDKYMVSYSEKEGLISFVGNVKLPDAEIQAYIRINNYGTGNIEVIFTRNGKQTTYTATFFVGSFGKDIVPTPNYYNGNNLTADTQTALATCVTILKRCETNILTKTSLTMEKMGFKSLDN